MDSAQLESAPEGFEALTEGRRTVWMDATVHAPELREALANASTQPPPAEDDESDSAGRGGSWVVDSGFGRLRVREYRRGGALKKVMPDRFRGAERFQYELHLAVQLYRAGLSIPRPIALQFEDCEGFGFRGWIVYKDLPEAVNALDAIKAGDVDAQVVCSEWIPKAAEVIWKAHEAGLEHADLHLGNLLFSGHGKDTVCWIIDLDKSTLHSPAVSPEQRMKNLKRLLRSCLKWDASRKAISRASRMRFLRHYLPESAERLTFKEAAARCSRIPLRHRIKQAVVKPQ